ncbi:MAG: RNA-binding protein hfq [Synechococcales cyanobacterium RM1_1_8]|nr:RNA-binding protein hfq [Synechococcales cyanobacterium RM1_1_8]
MNTLNAVTTAESPSVRQMQGFIREKLAVDVKLLTGDTIQGAIFWQDQDCISVKTAGADMLVWKHAIAFIQPRS